MNIQITGTPEPSFLNLSILDIYGRCPFSSSEGLNLDSNYRRIWAKQLFHTLLPPTSSESMEQTTLTSAYKTTIVSPAHEFRGSGTRRAQRDGLPFNHDVWGVTQEDLELG